MGVVVEKLEVEGWIPEVVCFSIFKVVGSILSVDTEDLMTGAMGLILEVDGTGPIVKEVVGSILDIDGKGSTLGVVGSNLCKAEIMSSSDWESEVVVI